MNKRSFVLLKNLFLSTSSLNSFRYCRDRKKRGKVIGSLIGFSILFIMMLTYCIFYCVGLGKMGLVLLVP